MIFGAFLKVLAIETSERVGSLATLRVTDSATEVLFAASLPSDQRSTRSLLPSIQALLKDCEWKPNQLDLICVSTGPGSFTGLRLGVTAAKTLAYATGAKLVGVHTLATIAAGVGTSCQRLWTVLDAQRQELFVSCFDPGWLIDNPPQTRVMRVDDWLGELRPGDSVSGPPLEKLADRLPDGVKPTDAATWRPIASNVGQLGIAMHERGSTVDAIQLVPQYFRKSAAEEKADQKIDT